MLVYQLLLIELPSSLIISLWMLFNDTRQVTSSVNKKFTDNTQKPVGNESIARRSLNERERKITWVNYGTQRGSNCDKRQVCKNRMTTANQFKFTLRSSQASIPLSTKTQYTKFNSFWVQYNQSLTISSFFTTSQRDDAAHRSPLLFRYYYYYHLISS